MENTKVPLRMIHHKIRLDVAEDVFTSLLCILDMDDELSKIHAYHIVKEALDDIKVIDRFTFRKAAKKVCEHITRQERFGACKFSLVTIDDNLVVMAWVVGGI